MTIAKKAWAATKYLKGLVNAEKKFHDVSFTLTPSTTASTQSFHAIAQGDASSDRNGNSLLAKYLRIRLNFAPHASEQSTLVRVLVVQDKHQVADNPPSYSDVVDSTGAGIDSFLNSNTVGRFRVLHDRKYRVANDLPDVTKNLALKINNHVRYNGTTTADIQKNGLYMFLVSDQATNTPTITGVGRLSYYDN